VAITYDIPTSAELRQIEQVLMPRLEEGRVGLELFPVTEVDAETVMWEQLDNYQGLQQLRGLNGQPQSVKKTGLKRYRMDPGVYGEFETLDEDELTRRRKIGQFGEPITIDDLVGFAQRKLLTRRLDRIELIVWTLVTTGTFSVAGVNGITHTDTFPLLTFTAGTPWSTLATSTPLANFRTVQLNARGQSVSYGRKARAIMNQVTANNLLANTNANDFGGRFRLQYGQTLNSLPDINTILAGNDLPQLEVYDQGYLSDGTDGNSQGAFVPFIPNGVVAVIGGRPQGQTVGEYRMTRNANNPDLAPGAYSRVIDRGEDRIPRTIEVHDGHNGGPAVFFPGAITIMNV
jgi:hypothetical protein